MNGAMPTITRMADAWIVEAVPFLSRLAINFNIELALDWRTCPGGLPAELNRDPGSWPIFLV